MEEQQAVARLQRGDIGGLAHLVRQYQVRAVRTAYLITRDRALAEDVTQAAFLKAYERIGQFDAGRPFGPWFLTIVARDAVKAAVQRERQTLLADDAEDAPTELLADRQPGPEALSEQAETAGEVWTAMERLSPDQRAAIVWRYFLGRGEATMATELACSRSTVKWRLHAARERLRVLLRPATTE